MKKILSFLLIILSAFAIAQTEDSLRLRLKKSTSDSAKTITYYELANSLRNTPSKAMGVISEMVTYSEKIKQKKDKALCYRKIGVLYHHLHHFDKALEFYYLSAEIFDELGDKDGLAGCYNNIANAFQNKGDISKDKAMLMRAIEYHEKCMAIRRELNDTITIKNSYNNIALAYILLEDYDKAIEYLKDPYEYFTKIAHDPNGVDITTSNLGEAYLGKGLKTKKPEYLRKALAYFTDRLNSYSGHGPTENHAIILQRCGKIYFELGQWDRAKEATLAAHTMFTEMDNELGLSQTSYQLSELFAARNDHKTAIEYLHMHLQYKDSVTNRTSRVNAEQMQIMYESTKKDKEIETLNHDREIQNIEINRHRNFLITAIAIILLILLLAFVLLSRYNLKKKANTQLSKAYQHIEQKNKQITDSINYAKRIQTAILPPTELLQKEFKNFFVYYQPKDIVSGDFYWFHRHNGARYFIIGDCTGHGVPGALMSMIGNTLLNEIILQKNITDPGKILEQLHSGVISSLRQQGYDAGSQDDGMDVSVCVLRDSEPNVLHYATANHSIFVKSQNNVKELSGDIFSIGGGFDSGERKFESRSEVLNDASFVVLSSDGYYDQFGGEKNSKFLVSRFETLIKELDLNSTDTSLNFKNAIEEWKGEHKQTDDILVAGFAV